MQCGIMVHWRSTRCFILKDGWFMWLCTGTRTLNRYQIIHISYVSEPPSDRTLYSYSILPWNKASKYNCSEYGQGVNKPASLQYIRVNSKKLGVFFITQVYQTMWPQLHLKHVTRWCDHSCHSGRSSHNAIAVKADLSPAVTQAIAATMPTL